MAPDPLLFIILLTFGVLAVSAGAKRTAVPAPIVLLLAGVVVAVIPGVPEIEVDPELVLFVLLPPLLYAAARGSSLIAIKANSRPIAMLAVSLVLVTAFAVGVTASAMLPGVTLAAGVALGAVVAPPDAVAATAVARRTGMPRRMVTILEGESLFNDATSLVTLSVATGVVAAGSVTAGHAVGEFMLASLGGAGIGAVVGAALGWIRRLGLHSVFTTSLSLITPLGVYLVAEEVHASGVIAVVVTGLLLAHRSPMDVDPATRLTEQSIWATVQFLLEGAVFALIGLQLPHIVGDVHESAGTIIATCLAVFAVVLLVRPVWIFGLTYLARVAPWRDGAARGSLAGLAVISWAGMRGVVSLAAAQSLPEDFPRRDLLLLVTVVVIVGTLVLQGLSLPLVIRRLGVQPPDPRNDALQVAHAQEQAGRAAEARLAELADDAPEPVVRRMRMQIEYRMYSAWERLGDREAGEAPTQAFARLRRQIIEAERTVFVRLRDSGELDEEVLRRVQRHLDLEESLLESLDEGTEEMSGHQEVLPPSRVPSCPDLDAATRSVPVADPHECPDCLAEGHSDWVHLRMCLECGHIGCCDSSPARHASGHYAETTHPVMGSAEPGESWRWCFKHSKLG